MSSGVIENLADVAIPRHPAPLLLDPSSEVGEDSVASRELPIEVVELHAGVLEKDQSSEAVEQREKVHEDDQEEETDVHASVEDLAYKMLVLSWDLDERVRQGLTYKQFAKYALMKLGVEDDITHFVRKDVPRRIASREEVLVQLAELGLNC